MAEEGKRSTSLRWRGAWGDERKERRTLVFLKGPEEGKEVRGFGKKKCQEGDDDEMDVRI